MAGRITNSPIMAMTRTTIPTFFNADFITQLLEVLYHIFKKRNMFSFRSYSELGDTCEKTIGQTILCR